MTQEKGANAGKAKKGTSANAQQDTKGLTVKKHEDMPEWYTQVCKKAGLADHSPIKGCMIIRPNGYAMWEAIQKTFNEFLAQDKVDNAYFPLFIPKSFFSKEAEHAQGFTPEVAWIEKKEDHHEQLALRPTSETIIYDSYSNWIRSWRDLPLKMNQWSNIVRWEVQDCKLFLRTREFLWQEGHCVYETQEACHKETLHYLERYRQIAEELLAVPVVLGRKSASERFAGANETYTIESFMPDGKSLQMGTSHDLGQGFAKAFNISYAGKDGATCTPWQNSWGISTRMIGAVILTHGDDKGLVVPPKAAKYKLAIVPIMFKGDTSAVSAAQELAVTLEKFNPLLDDSDAYSAGYKFNKYELEGVPLRIDIGPKDIEKKQVVLTRRDVGEKEFVPMENIVSRVEELLETMHTELFAKAQKTMRALIVETREYAAFKQTILDRKVNLSPHCGDAACEALIKEETAASTRAIPFDKNPEDGSAHASKKCVKCGKDAAYIVYFARAY